MKSKLLGTLCLFALVLGLSADSPLNVGASIGPNSPEGFAPRNDLPAEWHLRNKGGSDSAGLCVFTSIDHSARWQDVPQLVGFRDWMTRYPGGGWPQKVDQMIAKISTERGMSTPQYLQVEGDDLEILKRACKSGRVPGVTYGYSPAGRYNRKRISHMVSLVHADDKYFCVLDNNYPGPDKYEWLTPAEFRKTYTDTSGEGWSVILLNPGAFPYPKNRGAK